MTKGVGWPMGPCALVDLVGIDIHVHASEALYEATWRGADGAAGAAAADGRRGHLGRKTGQGFFSYD